MMKFDAQTQDLISAILKMNDVSSLWWKNHDEYPLEEVPIGREFQTEKGVCSKVAQRLTHDFSLDYNCVWMVFTIQDRFFKLIGWKSSYGSSNWNDYMEEVFEKTEVRKFYE